MAAGRGVLISARGHVYRNQWAVLVHQRGDGHVVQHNAVDAGAVGQVARRKRSRIEQPTTSASGFGGMTGRWANRSTLDASGNVPAASEAAHEKRTKTRCA